MDQLAAAINSPQRSTRHDYCVFGIDGLEQAIDSLAGHLPDELQPLFDWFEDSYVGRQNRRGCGRRPPMFPIEMWSMYCRVVDRDNRTNNFAEAAHRRLKAELGMAHPTIWKLIDSLRKVQHARDLFYEQLVAGHQPPKKLKKYRDADNRIVRIALTEEYRFHSGDRSNGGGVKVKIFDRQPHCSENPVPFITTLCAGRKCGRKNDCLISLAHCIATLFMIIRIFFTLSVTMTLSERPFSCLKHLKTSVRSTMAHDRLNGLTLLGHYPSIPLSAENVLDEFARQPRRCSNDSLYRKRCVA
ncbi:hypothetical protein T11_8895 [Trichinella zimbabwensis]|uniref:Uncharacterized protein n=1 Tax=Trichinella zimbabwensis TaxID=268475 RepID=A0A0V1I988_9BILA|nr:hypothetical protein T11_8895 [Trichinella zimbabwensis]